MAKPQIIHHKKFMDGRATPEEVHRAIGIRKMCAMCGRPPAIRMKVLMPLVDFEKWDPLMATAIKASNQHGPFIPTIPTTYGPMVKVSDNAFCDTCRVSAEREAAHGPSFALVEIDRGPGTGVTVVQVPRQFRPAGAA